MPLDNLGQNNRFAITFDSFPFGPILLSILLYLMTKSICYDPMGVLVCPVEFIFLKDGVRSVYIGFSMRSFYNLWLLIYNI